MVVLGDLSPDPSNRPPDENFLQSDVGVIVASSSDSEEEEISYEGYEVLPQEFSEIPNVEVEDSDSQESSGDEGTGINIHVNNIRELPSFDQSTKLEVTELWNTTNSSRQTDIIIDSTKEEEIKNAMAGFKLPLTAIPPWAAHIPEEEWKEQLKNRVALLNKVTAVKQALPVPGTGVALKVLNVMCLMFRVEKDGFHSGSLAFDCQLLDTLEICLSHLDSIWHSSNSFPSYCRKMHSVYKFVVLQLSKRQFKKVM